jgi:hypothetical protein
VRRGCWRRPHPQAPPASGVPACVCVRGQPFVGFTGYAFTRQWFLRVGDGSKSTGAPTTALLLELRQRQLLRAPYEGAQFDGPLDSPSGSATRYAKVDFDAIDLLYEAGMAGPVCGPLLRLFLAQYIRVYCHNRHLELSQLRVLQHMSCPFDVAFFVHQRLREVKLEEKAGSAKGNVSIEAHVKFDALKARADRQVRGTLGSAFACASPLPPSTPACLHTCLPCLTVFGCAARVCSAAGPPLLRRSQVLAAREHQAEFWAELSIRSPSLARLDAIGLCIERAMSGAEASFKRLLRLNPNSVPVMRRYAQFLAEVSGCLLWGCGRPRKGVGAGSEGAGRKAEPSAAHGGGLRRGHRAMLRCVVRTRRETCR